MVPLPPLSPSRWSCARHMKSHASPNPKRRPCSWHWSAPWDPWDMALPWWFAVWESHGKSWKVRKDFRPETARFAVSRSFLCHRNCQMNHSSKTIWISSHRLPGVKRNEKEDGRVCHGGRDLFNQQVSCGTWGLVSNFRTWLKIQGFGKFWNLPKVLVHTCSLVSHWNF